MRQYRFLFFLVIGGLTIRLVLANVPGFKIDTDDWFAWALRLDEVGFSKFYSNQVFSDYTPGYMYILSLLVFVKNLLQIDNPTFYLILKLPAIFAEIILGALIYLKLKQIVPGFYAKLAAFLIFLNPALIFNSSIWGQIDSILALSLFLTIDFLQNKKLILSSLLLGISLLIKPQTIAIIPVYFLFSIANFSTRNIIKIVLPFLIILFIFSLPFFTYSLIGLINLIITTASQYTVTSLFAYNFWGAVGFWIPDVTLWNDISYQSWGYILLAGYWIIIGYLYLKKQLSVYVLAALATLGFFFLPTRVHERYLYPGLVFLILVAVTYKSKLLLVLTGILSLLHFLNLYYVYVYYNEFYFKLPKVLYNPIIYNFLDTNSKGLSLVSTILFILIVISIIKNYAISSET
ncbi:MAG: hypothetical protein UT04_C0049G0006 [Candidatus Daviesbacteria bacterium GW2011_GWF2_38_7]|nr:MAG: hypothetical protein UT04_C0049G0006 [Candidatus Daviesbacteria bacterium GW2011_GWF2_38_7]